MEGVTEAARITDRGMHKAHQTEFGLKRTIAGEQVDDTGVGDSSFVRGQQKLKRLAFSARKSQIPKVLAGRWGHVRIYFVSGDMKRI